MISSRRLAGVTGNGLPTYTKRHDTLLLVLLHADTGTSHSKTSGLLVLNIDMHIILYHTKPPHTVYY
jgi:hypothetical protein